MSAHFTPEQHNQLLEALTRASFNFILESDPAALDVYLEDTTNFDEFINDAIRNWCDEDLRTNPNVKTYIIDNALHNQAIDQAEAILPNTPTPPTPPDPFSDVGFELDES